MTQISLVLRAPTADTVADFGCIRMCSQLSDSAKVPLAVFASGPSLGSKVRSP